MGMTCRLRQISSARLEEIDVNPDCAYEAILDPGEVSARVTGEKAIELVNALHEKYAPILDRIHQAHVKHVPNSEEDLAAYHQWLAEYQALTAPWSRRKKANNESATDNDHPELDIDKSWHVIHFLLTGQSEGGVPPHSLAILGGEPIPDRKALLSFGPALKLSVDEVRNVGTALAALPADELLTRYDSIELHKQEIYAASDDVDDARAYFGHYYEKVRAFYADAARKRNGMLIYLT